MVVNGSAKNRFELADGFEVGATNLIVTNQQPRRSAR